mmetsp:Transcript_18891/g.38940  ORF Transcript_18891/g.38940 Transcript_18891/m.38940 type:complete len:249 (+) Transcript_18891:529-1275(+)
MRTHSRAETTSEQPQATPWPSFSCTESTPGGACSVRHRAALDTTPSHTWRKGWPPLACEPFSAGRTGLKPLARSAPPTPRPASGSLPHHRHGRRRSQEGMEGGGTTVREQRRQNHYHHRPCRRQSATSLTLGLGSAETATPDEGTPRLPPNPPTPRARPSRLPSLRSSAPLVGGCCLAWPRPRASPFGTGRPPPQTQGRRSPPVVWPCQHAGWSKVARSVGLAPARKLVANAQRPFPLSRKLHQARSS